MKTFLLSLTVVLTFIVASESGRIPFFRFMKELDELRASTYLRHQEQVASLTCASCDGANEASCTASQQPTQCPVSALNCFILELVSNTGVTNFTRGCFSDALCNPNILCSALNMTNSNSLQSCAVRCCTTNLCNAGVLPTTTPPPSTAATTTMAPTTPTMAPTTPTMAPTTPTMAPTTPVVFGGPLVGVSGTFTTPNFPNNYPNNLNVVWTRIIAAGRRLRITFMPFVLSDTDSLTVSIGGLSITFTGNFQRGKRSIHDVPKYYDEYIDEDNGYFYDDDVDDAFYYYYDGRRKEEDDDSPFRVSGNTLLVRGSNQQATITFNSNASGNAQGFSANFQDENDPGSASSASSASGSDSSDEEE